MTIALIDEAVDAGARLEKACEVVGISTRTLERWRADDECVDRRAGPRHAPAHQLSAAEKAKILEVASSPEFRNMSPKQIVPLLADRKVYIGSEATFYRVLREADQLKHRGRARPPRAQRPKELIAKAPNQVWCWDITYLRAPVRGTFYFLYLVVDVFSRVIARPWNLCIHIDNAPAPAERPGSSCPVPLRINRTPVAAANLTPACTSAGVAASITYAG